MPNPIVKRFSSAWNAFTRPENDLTTKLFSEIMAAIQSGVVSYGGRPYTRRPSSGSERSITASLFNRIAIDISSLRFSHIRVDGNERYVETLETGLHECLSTSSNIDQTGTAFIRDVVMSLFDEGVVAIVPVDTTRDPTDSDAYDIQSLRVGRVTAWYPAEIRVDLYNDRVGRHEEIVVPKWTAAVIENPLYSVMNEQNSTLKRLINKLNLLDVVDEASSSGKLDIIIQLPYLLKGEARKKKAEDRRKDIEDQLKGSEYGIAYTDATEKVIQLNRPSENNLMAQIEYLTSMLYSQLGITETVMNGTADEATMLNYYRRTVEPVAAAIVEGMYRTFLSKTARTQGQRIAIFSDPFKLVPMSQLAEIADKFTRNEIMTANEFRPIVGLKPSTDPNADVLRNKNIALPPVEEPALESDVVPEEEIPNLFPE